MREFYKVAAGSRRIGLELAASDIDYWVIADIRDRENLFNDKIHNIVFSIEKGVLQLSGKVNKPNWIITLFPNKEDNSPIAAYMRDNAERIISACRKPLFDLLLDYIEDYGIVSFKASYYYNSKMIAYRLFWMQVFIEYAACGQMGEAIQRTCRNDFYKRIRNKEFRIEELEASNEAYKAKLLSTSGFYDNPVDEEYLENVRLELKEIIKGMKE